MKLLKFDTLYPAQYLDFKISTQKAEIKKMSFIEFNDWLIGLRLNFSDYYTYNLRLIGWDAKEFFILGSGMYLRKLGKQYFGSKFFLIYTFYKFFSNLFKKSLKEMLIERIIEVENPDVLFIREQSSISSLFWDRFRDKMLVVSRMECGIPKYWSPACFDVIYTNINTYRDFFISNRFKTHTNYSGFDQRVYEEVSNMQDIDYDIAFVGGLGPDIFKEKTEFLESFLVASNGKYRFAWWGYKENSSFDSHYPRLSECYNGITGGLDMFHIYKNVKIILNDYGVAAGGQGMNQRIYEVLGVGGFLLTRNSKMFDKWGQCIATYDSLEDCCSKVDYYLSDESARLNMAKKGHEYVVHNFNYQQIMHKLSEELKSDYEEKFGIILS